MHSFSSSLLFTHTACRFWVFKRSWARSIPRNLLREPTVRFAWNDSRQTLLWIGVRHMESRSHPLHNVDCHDAVWRQEHPPVSKLRREGDLSRTGRCFRKWVLSCDICLSFSYSMAAWTTFSLYIMDIWIGLHQAYPKNLIWSACTLAQMGVSTLFVHFGMSSNSI